MRRRSLTWLRRFTTFTPSFGQREGGRQSINTIGSAAHGYVYSHRRFRTAIQVIYKPVFVSILAQMPLEVLPLPLFEKAKPLIFAAVLVDGELWTNESVFWQNKLRDRAKYEVVYRIFPPPGGPTWVLESRLTALFKQGNHGYSSCCRDIKIVLPGSSGITKSHSLNPSTNPRKSSLCMVPRGDLTKKICRQTAARIGDGTTGEMGSR